MTAAAAVVFAVSGCLHGHSASAPPAAPATTTVPPSSVAAPKSAPLPPPEALTEVLYRLADPALPGLAKLHLVEGSRPADAPVFDKFANALLAGGFAPPTFNATDIAWSDRDPSDVTATVNVTGPAVPGFTFPMEFKPHEGGWQLSAQTAATLLAFDTSHPSPSPSPTP